MSVELVFGGGSFMDETRYPIEEIHKALDILEDGGVKTIDTATIYVKSEELLGKVDAASRFIIDSKYPGAFSPELTTPEAINATAESSLKKLQTDQLDVYYIHAPDRRVPLEDTLSSVNTLHQAGKFRRFGLSNFLPAEVEEVVRVAKEKNYVLPTVYQGNYNAVARLSETELFPVLRKHNISFYAYSPIAGGFLTKDVDQLRAGGEGRWDPNSRVGGIYHSLYNKAGMLEGLQLWGKIAEAANIPKAELAYRWVVYHSALKGEYGDKVIFGSRNNEQLKQTLAGIKKGPLDPESVQKIEEVWAMVKDAAPLDNFNSFIAQNM
ncbi:NADP-dependent oxidoreductase domain-containing protein [Aspergillus ambiguus]|uniref:aldo/keto reductase family protein n=1 Tax=Aspergillus ambiguus TaxID=176160 RepID=UPI003CCDE9B1